MGGDAAAAGWVGGRGWAERGTWSSATSPTAGYGKSITPPSAHPAPPVPTTTPHRQVPAPPIQDPPGPQRGCVRASTRGSSGPPRKQKTSPVSRLALHNLRYGGKSTRDPARARARAGEDARVSTDSAESGVVADVGRVDLRTSGAGRPGSLEPPPARHAPSTPRNLAHPPPQSATAVGYARLHSAGARRRPDWQRAWSVCLGAGCRAGWLAGRVVGTRRRRCWLPRRCRDAAPFLAVAARSEPPSGAARPPCSRSG